MSRPDDAPRDGARPETPREILARLLRPDAASPAPPPIVVPTPSADPDGRQVDEDRVRAIVARLVAESDLPLEAETRCAVVGIEVRTVVATPRGNSVFRALVPVVTNSNEGMSEPLIRDFVARFEAEVRKAARGG